MVGCLAIGQALAGLGTLHVVEPELRPIFTPFSRAMSACRNHSSCLTDVGVLAKT